MCKLTIDKIDSFREIWTRKSALSIKPALGIGKILFHFFDRGSKEKIDCYMNVEDFTGKLLELIRTGELLRDIKAEKAKGEQYPKPVWNSPYGGDKNATPPISRSFTIAPGSGAEVVITAYAYPGQLGDDGKISPQKDASGKTVKPTFTIRVGMAYDELRTLRIVAESACMEYISRKYSIENIEEYEGTGNGNQDSPKPASNSSAAAKAPEPVEQEKQQDNSSVPETVKFKASFVVSNPIGEGTGASADYAYLNAVKKTDGDSVRLWIKKADMAKDSKRWDDFKSALAGGSLEATFDVEETKGKFRILAFG